MVMPKSLASIERTKITSLNTVLGKIDGLCKSLENDLQTLRTLPTDSSTDIMDSKISFVQNSKRQLMEKIKRVRRRLDSVQTEYVPMLEADVTDLRKRIEARETSIEALVATMQDHIAYYTDINTNTLTLLNAVDSHWTDVAQVTKQFQPTYQWLSYLTATVQRDLAQQTATRSKELIDQAEERFQMLQHTLSRYKQHGWGPSRDHDVPLLHFRQEIDHFKDATMALWPAIFAAENCQEDAQQTDNRQNTADLPLLLMSANNDIEGQSPIQHENPSWSNDPGIGGCHLVSSQLEDFDAERDLQGEGEPQGWIMSEEHGNLLAMLQDQDASAVQMQYEEGAVSNIDEELPADYTGYLHGG